MSKRSRVFLSFYLLLPAFITGCGDLTPQPAETLIPMETTGVFSTEQAPATIIISDIPERTPTQFDTPTPGVTPTSKPKPTGSPTPLFEFNLSGYDPDIFQPIDITHNPPLIARSGETARLIFNIVNTINCTEPLRICRLEPVLHYTYGDTGMYQTVSLSTEIVDEMESLVARLPATNPEGEGLRYYSVFSVPEAGYALRYPIEGTIDLFATNNFISIDLPVERAVEKGDSVYNFYWGYGIENVGQAYYEGYPRRVGPPALDVSEDGGIALLDPVNERVLIYNPDEESYFTFSLPFTYKFNGDLAFDQKGRLMICDFQGEEVQGALVRIPYCYRLLPDGALDVSTPVYGKFPSKITREHQVLDGFDFKLVSPFNSQGEANPRGAQRQKQTWELPYRFVEGLWPYVARFADVKEDVAFEIHSVTPLGVILDFERTPQGYGFVFGGDEQIRAAWIDRSGRILKDITLPNGWYSELSLNGQVAFAEDGSLYVLSSTERGIEIHFVTAP